ncbi:MAG: endonuclease/exonuclease/phosphatase family protein [Pirellulaceae bacterium]
MVRSSWLPVLMACLLSGPAHSIYAQPASQELPSDLHQPIRIASFNVALNRKQPGALVDELAEGDAAAAKKIAEVIQRVRPHVLFLNEVDHDDQGRALQLLRDQYLAVGQNGQAGIEYPHSFVAGVNTGVDSGIDLNRDGKTGEPEDAIGYGAFPGQYGMAVLSQFPIDEEAIRTFQKFLWKDMPDALLPVDPATGKGYYDEPALQVLRLSSKSHWDVPVQIGEHTVHLIGSHPTPPVFDGPEDRNGRRNHDEIRLVADYIGGQADYLYDDKGETGGLESGSLFVIVGDLNADPQDGDSANGAARQLTENPGINHSKTPASQGAAEAAQSSGEKNVEHSGDPAQDTGDFNDKFTGNLRIDYCLPALGLEIADCGVFWPADDEDGHELNDASDHHLVWIDVILADDSSK